MTDEEKRAWRSLCGLAVQLCGSQVAFKREANVLVRLVKKYGAEQVEHALRGAQFMGWKSLLQLGDADGDGWRWALESFWKHENKVTRKAPESVRSIFKGWGKN